MTLTMRPTGLGSGINKDVFDYNIFSIFMTTQDRDLLGRRHIPHPCCSARSSDDRRGTPDAARQSAA